MCLRACVRVCMRTYLYMRVCVLSEGPDYADADSDIYVHFTLIWIAIVVISAIKLSNPMRLLLSNSKKRKIWRKKTLPQAYRIDTTKRIKICISLVNSTLYSNQMTSISIQIYSNSNQPHTVRLNGLFRFWPKTATAHWCRSLRK